MIIYINKRALAQQVGTLEITIIILLIIISVLNVLPPIIIALIIIQILLVAQSINAHTQAVALALKVKRVEENMADILIKAHKI